VLRHWDVHTLDLFAYVLTILTGVLVVTATGSFVLAMASVTALGAIQASLLCAAKIVRGGSGHHARVNAEGDNS
jgi:hypothetical protein